MSDDNLINDEEGDSTLQGVDGADVFVFSPGHGNDAIAGFSDGEDRIDLSGFASITSFDDLTIRSDANGVTIDLTDQGGGTIRLDGFDVADLGAADFLFRVNQTIEGSADDDTLTGAEGDDTITGLGGDDFVYGHGGDDTIKGGAGDDFLIGGHATYDDEVPDGDDTLHGGEGDDWAYGGLGSDTLYGGGGDDVLVGGPDGYVLDGHDEVHGEDGDDVIVGGAGNDSLYGGAGNDAIRGDWLSDFSGAYEGEADDTIDGGAGDDTLYGGQGADTFVFRPGHGNDTIKDFADGENQIDLTAMSGITGIDNLTITRDGSTAVVDLTAYGGGTIRLQNVDVDNLDAGDFLFREPPPTDPPIEGG